MQNKSFTVNFIKRKFADTPSIEGVFRRVADELIAVGIKPYFQKMPFGNGFTGLIGNLLFFRPIPADIFHITGHIHYAALLLPRNKTVLTIHDLGILRNRKGLRRRMLKKLFFDFPVRRLKYITVVSEFTRDELSELTGRAREDIRVVENPMDTQFYATVREFNVRCPTILQIGTAANKNLANLITAVKSVNCRLKIIGRIGERETEQLKKAGVQYENHWDLNRTEIVKAYRNSDILSFCSTYEGFGLPIIEAQASGIPVVTSDLNPMREVAGGGAVLVDPSDPISIRNGILSVVDDERLRKNLIQTGFQNTSRFSPDRIAQKYRSIYMEIIETLTAANSSNAIS